MTASNDTAQTRGEITVYVCAECGHVEGESPQAGCCPKCGVRSDAQPLVVVPAAALAATAEKAEEAKRYHHWWRERCQLEQARKKAAVAALLTAQQEREELEQEAEDYSGKAFVLRTKLREAEEANIRLRQRMENAANALPDPMHPDFPRQFADAQARGLAWLDDDAAAALADTEQEKTCPACDRRPTTNCPRHR